MSESLVQQKIIKIIKECDLHRKRITFALSKLKLFMPLTSEHYKHLDNEQVEDLDQFLFRFSKLQDTIGQRFFSAVLEAQEEPVEEASFLDRLNRLEQLKVIDSKEQWLNLRNMRNKFAHEYEDDPEAMSAIINLIYDAYPVLEQIFFQVKRYYEKN